MPSSSAPIAADTPATPAASASTRRWEIDALRGLMLVLMTVTHIPTRFSDPFGQPLGYVSAAEGFVMLSAYVAGMVYTQRQLRDGAEAMRSAFLRRAFKIYLCQAVLLVFLLGLVAVLGVVVRQAAITDMVSFFLDHPLTAFFSGLLADLTSSTKISASSLLKPSSVLPAAPKPSRAVMPASTREPTFWPIRLLARPGSV